MPAKKEKKRSYSERFIDYMKENMSGTTGDAIKKHNESLKQTLYEIDKQEEDKDESKKRKR